ncbi:hypothetical protein [Clostridium tetani]|uniref:Fimbrial assembly protein n=1 Tax=Clostridium tetani (strain Massachusetts / E88) TaxID=212717 RepID=Q894F1_CLOTE|nr:hypothetical protein [Clostridium tetani]AAO36141.1 hypothetical protein CTC_01596 [Clostridium tetani E88]KGI37900.1 hypothetical protein KY52_10205 [Clostridium tetani]KGI43853.1 hypothetical protein KY55_05380 [Clostridium tetani]KGI45377.1 hypothetical protein KY54_04555 [Clostridium tetani]KHO31682.1 hypothetical protein OR63_08170 [Clostridium tetani]
MKEFNFIPEEYLNEKNLKIDSLLRNIIKVLFVFIVSTLFILNKNSKKLNLLKREEMDLKSKMVFEKYELEEHTFYLWKYSMNTLKDHMSLEKIELSKDNLILNGIGNIKTYENLLEVLEDNKNIRLLEFKSPNNENEFKYTVTVEVGKNEK